MKDDGKKVVELFPLSPIGFYMAGTALNRLGEYQEANYLLNEGIFLIVDDDQLKGEFKAQLAESAIGRNDKKNGIQLFEEALKLSPNNSYVLSRYYFSAIYKLKDLKIANDILGNLKKTEASENQQLEWLALFSFADKKYLDAYNITQKIAPSYRYFNKVIELQGDLLFFQNKKQEALQKWQEAKKNGHNSIILERKITTGNYHEPL